MKPSNYGLHHKEFRPYQLESIDFCLSLYDDGTQVGIIEAPTGSGKTVMPKAISNQHSVTTLVKTKALQMENYGNLYAFDVLYGRGNYPCIHEDAPNGRTAADCLFHEKGMHKCPRSVTCPYAKQKMYVMASDRRSLNYAYFMIAKWPRAKEIKSTYLFCDECHELSDTVIERAGIHVSERRRAEWELPPFPRLADFSGVLSKPPGYTEPVQGALAWLDECHTILGEKYKWLSVRAKDDKYRRIARRCEYFGHKISATIYALRMNPNDWFIQSGPTVGRTAEGRLAPALTAKPLTARHHAMEWFGHSDHLVMMSATVGKFDVFCRELGIPNDYAKTRRVPSVWPPESRPVFVIKDGPAIGRSAGPEDYHEQAVIIARLILGCPPDWAGIIHVTRITEATKLANRLAKLGLQDRVIAMPRMPTDQQMAWWTAHKQEVPNAIVTSWSWSEGVDLGEEKICISAKTPFPCTASPFEKARMEFSHSMYNQRTAWRLEQSLGRTRRGRPEDYDLDGEHRGLVVIVDENWRKIQKYFSEALRQSIVEIPRGEIIR